MKNKYGVKGDHWNFMDWLGSHDWEVTLEQSPEDERDPEDPGDTQRSKAENILGRSIKCEP